MKIILKLLILFWVVVFVHVGFAQASSGFSSKEDVVSKAKQGDADAQFNLGSMYYQGKGVPKDYKQAIYWYTKAAEQGDDEAQFNLGLMYYEGQGVPKDYIQTYAWWNIAASQGQQGLIKIYFDLVLEKMSRSQIEEGQKLSGELFEKINKTMK